MGNVCENLPTSTTPPAPRCEGSEDNAINASPAQQRFNALLCAVVASCFLLASGWGVWDLCQRLYLLHRGVEVQGVVEDMVFHPAYVKRGMNIERVTVKYAFKTSSDEKISNSVERERSQIGGIVRGHPLQVLYVEGRPQLNLPRALFGDLGSFAFAIIPCFAGFAVAAFVSRRFWRMAHQN
jgi:hypothetical protein